MQNVANVESVEPKEIKYKKSTWQLMKENRQSYLMISPFVILFTVFTIIPVIASLALSFTYFNALEFPSWRGLMNYQRLFLEDDIFIKGLTNTFIFAIILGPVGYIMCFMFAWFVNELPNRVRPIMTLIFYAPSIAGSAVTVWGFIMNGDSAGYLNAMLIRWGFIQEPIQWFTDPKVSFGAIIVIQLWLGLGTAFLSFVAGFKGVDTTLYEAGAVDGIKNRFQELVSITIPQMKHQMLFGAIMQIAGAFTVGSVVTQLAGYPSTDYSLHTVMQHIQDYGGMRYEMGYAAAVQVVLFAIMIISKQVITRLLRSDN